MKKCLFISLCAIFSGNFSSAQVTGDYQSIATGNWSTIAIWQRYNGSAFVAATEYPGQTSGTGEVTIQDGNLVALDVSPANPIDSLLIQGGPSNTSLTINGGFTLTVTHSARVGPPTSGSGIIKAINLNGATAQLNLDSLFLVQGGNDQRITRLQFANGGIVNITGPTLMSITQPQRTIIQFTAGGGTLNFGGNVIGGQIIPGTGTINFNGSGTQSIGNGVPITLTNLGLTNAATILQLTVNLTVTGTLTLTNGKINTGVNTLTLSNIIPANQLTGGSTSSYVYSTGAGRLARNSLAAATPYNLPIGTSTNYMPVIVTPTTASNFSANVFSPAASNGVEGGPAFPDKTKMVDATWNIDRPAGTGNSTITIQWVDALEGSSFAGFNDSQIGASRFAGSWSAAIASSANAAANTVTATFGAFSPFGVGIINLPLPVKFGPIKAYEKLNGIQLDWKVYSESRVNNYEVERSADGSLFTTVGSVPALNVNAEANYGFFDANPLPGTSFYRIKNNDFDGKSSYSQVIRIDRNKSNKGLNIYPNPVLNGIVLLQGSDLARGNYKISIFTASGQEIFKQQIAHSGGTISQTIELPLIISKGVYMFSVRDESGVIIFSEKLLSQ